MRGAKFVGNYPMAPIPNGIGLGITMMSYLDEIYYTVQGCRERTPDIQLLSGFMNEAILELLEAAKRQVPATADVPAPRRKAKARKATVARKKAAAAHP